MLEYIAESERLWLQHLSLDHLHDFQSMMSDPRANIWSISHDPKTVFTQERAAEFIQDNRPTLEKPFNRRWAIVLRPPPKYVLNGTTVLQSAEDGERNPKPKMIGVVGIPREAEIGYKIHPEFWGKGYMTEALHLAIDVFWQSEDFKIHGKLSAGADPENLGSIRVLEKVGFQKGELKKDFYEREVDGVLMKQHIQCYFLERPTVAENEKSPHDSGE